MISSLKPFIIINFTFRKQCYINGTKCFFSNMSTILVTLRRRDSVWSADDI